MQESIEKHIVEQLKAELPDLRAIYLFGSLASENYREDSDIDLAILGYRSRSKAECFSLATNLALSCNRDVDLIDLFSASTVLRSQVVSTGRLLFAHDKTDIAGFECFVYADYAKLNEERIGILENVKQRGHIYGG